ncbi:hypothetical protein VTH06DRAFT_4556 [Thermothelomyces fergusii]
MERQLGHIIWERVWISPELKGLPSERRPFLHTHTRQQLHLIKSQSTPGSASWSDCKSSAARRFPPPDSLHLKLRRRGTE